MFNKVIAAMFAILLLLALAACAPASETGTDAPTIGSTATAHSTTAPPTKPNLQETPTFEPIVLIEDHNTVVKITAVEKDNLWGYTLKVYLENKTDKELMFTVDDVSVNGFMCDPFWAETVAAGKKSNTTISWLKSNFEENGIQEVEDITFTLRIYDSNDILADSLLEKSCTIKPEVI